MAADLSRANRLVARANALAAGAFRQSVLAGYEDDSRDLNDRIAALEQQAFEALPAWMQAVENREDARQQREARKAVRVREAVAARLDARYPYTARLIHGIHTAARYNAREVRLVRLYEARIDREVAALKAMPTTRAVRPRKREWAVLRRSGTVRVRRYGARWQADGCEYGAPTAGAAAWIKAFLDAQDE